MKKKKRIWLIAGGIAALLAVFAVWWFFFRDNLKKEAQKAVDALRDPSSWWYQKCAGGGCGFGDYTADEHRQFMIDALLDAMADPEKLKAIKKDRDEKGETIDMFTKFIYWANWKAQYTHK